jgi:outer membrane immunogenic protein
MKKLLLATSALVLAGPALGADLRIPTKAPAIVAAPVPFSWTGCYVGAHAGYGWGRTNITDPNPAGFANGTTQTANTRGALAGGQIGCDYQFAGGWVFGVEGSAAWADIKGTVNDPFFAGKNFSSRTDFIADATGRIGYSFDRVLFYGKGGGAWAHNRFGMIAPLGPFGTSVSAATETRFGWVVGAGVEYAFTSNWSAKLEYNHYDFGSRQITLTGVGFAGPFTTPENISQRVDTVKVGLNYRFGGGPVVARY